MIQPTGTPASYPTSSAIITDVIDNVLSPTTSTPLFTYFDTNYSGSQSGLSSPITVSAIRLVDIIFRADVQPKQAPGPDYFSMLVDIRNLRSN